MGISRTLANCHGGNFNGFLLLFAEVFSNDISIGFVRQQNEIIVSMLFSGRQYTPKVTNNMAELFKTT